MPKKKKLISIIIPYYKKKLFISKTLKTILNQSYKNFEIIIIYDDLDLFEFKYLNKISKKDKRIKIFKNKKNLGVSKSRNIGVKKSKGKYIAFIDADDLWKKNKLETQIQIMEKNKHMISHTEYEIINKDNNIIGYMPIKESLEYNKLIYSCDIGLSTVMINSKLKSKLKFPNIITKEDFILWLRLSKTYNIHGIKKNLASWRKNDSSFNYTLRKFKDAYEVYSKYEKFNFLKASLFVLLLSLNFIKKSLIQKYNI